MVFITAGMGGGTGTGAAPVIARAAREHNILTVGVVTKPFQFEGAHRMRTAETGIQELQQFVDTLIVIPNQNLFRIANEKTTFADAFKMADEVLHSGVRGVTDLMVMPGLINLDFADIRTVMSEMGKAMMGTGEAEGPRRAVDAAEAAISNPLLDEVSLKGARAMLINITAGMDIALFEVDEAVNRVRAEVDPDANVIFGSTFDPTMEGRLRVSVVATGIDAQTAQLPLPNRQPTLDVIRGGIGGRYVTPRSARRHERRGGLGGDGRLGRSRGAAGHHDGDCRATRYRSGRARDRGRRRNRRRRGRSSPLATAAELRIEPTPEMTAAAAVPMPIDAGRRDAAPSVRLDTFIAPRAIDPGPRVTISAAAQAEIAGQAEKKRGYSLFERVTGAARRAEAAAQTAPAAPRTGPTFGPAMPATAVAQPAPTNAGAGAAGHRLCPMRSKPSTPEDDLLEIPAFLRRQAN